MSYGGNQTIVGLEKTAVVIRDFFFFFLNRFGFVLVNNIYLNLQET